MKFTFAGLIGCLYPVFMVPFVAAQPSALAGKVNVFLGTSGDHGQLSPAASYPFGMLSICPETYPKLHAGYEYRAKTIIGFTHNRFEGVGCQGSGGNILIKPFIGTDPAAGVLSKVSESASPGSYRIGFSNGIRVSIAVFEKSGVEAYSFPTAGAKGFSIDLSHTLANRFVAEKHTVSGNTVSGWIDSRTTCNAGTYRVYYALKWEAAVTINEGTEHLLRVSVPEAIRTAKMAIAFSSVDEEHARNDLPAFNATLLAGESSRSWSELLSHAEVSGNPEREKLFYSLLYRTLQSPYLISEKDGSYRATDGSARQANTAAYSGWAIWDNYRTQLPLLAILYPDRYQGMVNSIAAIYRYGKKDYATQHEPSNTVRTEHAGIVLLDAYRKGFRVDFPGILDSLIADAERLDFTHPDKALESSYDIWALSQILDICGKPALAKKYLEKAADYKTYWNNDFKDLSKPDVDKVSARGMYQGTIWQYRWLVPFDVKGLIALAGGEKAYLQQLDQFFDGDYYNHANEPDIQAPFLYNMTSTPWRSQELVHRYAVDTVVQYYFNDNSRGIDPFVDRVYRNRPEAYIRTMDDDAGAMSAWFVLASLGLSPACVGWPVYYLNLPLFREITLRNGTGKALAIRVNNYSDKRRYVTSATLNGQPLHRNWITHQELLSGGTLVFTAGEQPNRQWGTASQWITAMGN